MLHAVILAGGSGTRFWPESRESRPKQLLDITGHGTMIRVTIERILPVIPFQRIMVVTAASHAQEIMRELPELSRTRVVSEPRGRNTSPCVALAAYKLAREDPDGLMVVLPADHLIKKEEAFRHALRVAASAAAGNHLLTFGIRPTRPETGYGYIELGPPASEFDSATIYHVKRFVEKPDRSTAEQYLDSGNYLWNSGMFVWKISTIIKAFETHLPSIARALERLVPVMDTPEEAAALARTYEELTPISIDHGIMEKADNVLTLPIDVDWSDVGSWASLEDVWDLDENENATKGEVFVLEGKRCVVSSPRKVATILGVDDLIVVDTADALMVCRKDRAQDVAKIREILKKSGYDQLL